VCVALVIQHAMRMCHIVICGLPRSTIFVHIISYKRHDKKNYYVQYVGFHFLKNVSDTFVTVREMSEM